MQTDLYIFNELYNEQIANGIFFCLNDFRHERKCYETRIPRGVCAKTNIILL